MKLFSLFQSQVNFKYFMSTTFLGYQVIFIVLVLKGQNSNMNEYRQDNQEDP